MFLCGYFGWDIDWFGILMLVFVIILLMIVWKMFGYYVFILIFGFVSINYEIYEVVVMDGFGRFRIFWKVIVLMLYLVLFIVIVLVVGVSFGIFIEVY